jgi:serine/threonine protein kinase/formylglycine-generating enzyme required for sulfatase activity
MASSETGKPIKNGTPNSRADATTGGDRASAPIEFGKLVGRVLGGRYQLNEFIGSGGMGEIYRARRTHIGDTVAVKVLRADVVTNEKSRQRFYREARAAAMLHHPNAVVIHDFGEDSDGLAYIVMELLLGRSLRQVLAEDGALDPVRAYGIVRQACAALEAGHRSGIIHRDIKPDNIILLSHDEDNDHVKILDFGIAKLRDKALDTLSVENNLTNVGTVIGTPSYMSPEQCQGEEADARSDIYSLGVVMYEILTGVMPFIAKTPTGVAIKHATEKPRPLRDLQPELPAEIEAVVLHALEKAPDARPQTMLELAREFASALKQSGATTALGRTGTAGMKAVRIDTPRTDEVQTQRPLVPDTDPSGDSFKTSISESNVPTPREAVSDQRLTEVLPNRPTDQFRTVMAESPEATSFETRITEEPVAEAPRDAFATMIPAAPDAEPPRDAFATMIPAAPEAEPPRDAFATMIPAAPEPRAEMRTEIISAGTEVLPPTAQGFAATEIINQPVAPLTPTVTETKVAPPEPKAEKQPEKKKDKKKDKAKDKVKVEAPMAPAAATVATNPAKVINAPAIPAQPSGGKSGSQKVLLAGIAAIVLAGAIVTWSFLTKDNQPQPVTEKPATGPVTATGNQPVASAVTPPSGMVYIPGGEFRVGRDDGEDNEKPAHSVIVAPFFLDQNEVTNEQYAKFIEATGYLLPPSWQGKRYPAGDDKLPVTDVSWEDAAEYAKWAGKRLPTEEEWELAARGNEGRLYPWGNAWQEDVANIAKDENDKRRLAPVGTYLRGQSFYGALDMTGNAWEWTASDYKGYQGKTLELPEGYQNLKVIRGGSYFSTPAQATATYRRGWPGTRKDWPEGVTPDYGQTGFRCAQDVPQR